VACCGIAVAHRDGEPIAASGQFRFTREEVQLGAGVEHTPNPIDGVCESDRILLFESEAEFGETVEKGQGWLSGKEWMLAMPQFPTARQMDRPKPYLFPRLFAAEHKNVLVNSSRQDALEFLQQLAVHQNEPVGTDPADLQTALLGNALHDPFATVDC